VIDCLSAAHDLGSVRRAPGVLVGDGEVVAGGQGVGVVRAVETVVQRCGVFEFGDGSVVLALALLVGAGPIQ
jgi:hypothetical protein